MVMHNQSSLARGLGQLVRPRYSPGLLLEDEDLTSGVDYTRELTRLMFRSLFGCGVICGLTVKGTTACDGNAADITVDCGLALDCMGNPIQVTSKQTFHYEPPKCEALPRELWVTICYVEMPCRPRDVSCSCDGLGDDARVEKTRLRDGFEIYVSAEQPACACCCIKPKAPPKTDDQKCCPDPAAAVETTTDPKPADPKADPKLLEKPSEQDDVYAETHACFEDHVTGVCACECGCNCIVIAKLNVSGAGAATEISKPAPGIVRHIRPVLVGQMPGFRECADGAEGPKKAAPVA
jgi:hypothetical protein